MATELFYCEVCGELIGHINSRYVRDDEGEGVWICYFCEENAGRDAHLCPCGCNNDRTRCVYYPAPSKQEED